MSWKSAAEFARQMKCSRANVTHAVKSGRIAAEHVRRNGKSVQINTGAISFWEATTSKRHYAHRAVVSQTVPVLLDDLPLAWGCGRKSEEIKRHGVPTDPTVHSYGKPTDRVMAGLDAAPDWQCIAEFANASLDCTAWGPPPWPADRWATLAMVLSLAEDGAAGGLGGRGE